MQNENAAHIKLQQACPMKKTRPAFVGIIFLCLQTLLPSALPAAVPGQLGPFLETHCIACHDGAHAEAGLDLPSLKWSPKNSHNESTWVKIHDRVKSGEMPPEEASELSDTDREAMTKDLSQRLIEAREKAYAQNGRAVSRRVNRFEYENILRDLLHDPYLKIADQLPLDGEVHGFTKVGTALDVSHVQIDAYLDVAEVAFWRAIEFPAEKPQPTTNRYYAREEGRMWAGGGIPAGLETLDHRVERAAT